ncbi:MAG: hypothetical protein KH972_08640 [Peptostreptococcaceae bacterium]|nr:hypothetical protein [Peptostreptococcaceae bacterium]
MENINSIQLNKQYYYKEGTTTGDQNYRFRTENGKIIIENHALVLKDNPIEIVSKGYKFYRGTGLDGYYNVDIPVSNFDGVSSDKYYIECSDINGSVTKTEGYSFDVKDGVNIGYVQDFETDISGFEFGGE